MTRKKSFSCCKPLFIFFLIFLFHHPLVYAGFFKWVDKDGHVHYADKPASIPQQYRKGSDYIATPSSKTAPIPESEPAAPALQPPPQEPATPPAEEDLLPSDAKAIIIKGDIKLESIDEELSSRFTGEAVNRTSQTIDNITIEITLFNKDDNEIKKISTFLTGAEGQGILGPGETGTFAIKAKISMSSISRYEYRLNWRYTTHEGK